jgi:hypothetical protein
MGNLPAVLGQFLLTAIAVTVEASIAILFDFILAIFVILQNAGGGLLDRGNSTALYDPVFIAMEEGSAFTLINGDILSENVVTLPTTFIPLFFLAYLGISSLKAFIDTLQGDSTKFLQLQKVGITVTVALLIIGGAYNAFLGMVIETRSAEYLQEIQWALPANVKDTVPDVPVFSLTQIVLSANLTSTNNLGVKMSHSDIATITGISAFTYFVSILASGGINQTTYLLIMLIQFIGRNLFPIFLLCVAGYAVLEKIPYLGNIARHVGGIVLLSVVVIPLLASITGGAAFAAPIALAQFNAAQSERVKAALTITSETAYERGAVCQALTGESGASCAWLPSVGEEPTESGRSEIISSFTGMMMETFIAAIALIIFNSIQMVILRSAHFAGSYLAGVTFSSVSAYGQGQKGFTSSIWKEEYGRAVENNGAFGQIMQKALNPVAEGLNNLARSQRQGSGSFSQQSSRTKVENEVRTVQGGGGGDAGDVDQTMLTQLNSMAERSDQDTPTGGVGPRGQQSEDDWGAAGAWASSGNNGDSEGRDKICPYCGNANAPSRRTCGSCGASLAAEEEIREAIS